MISVVVLYPLLRSLIRNKWTGRENIPKSGGVILAPNHLSYVDWGTDALFLYAGTRRYPVFLIKDSAFKVKFIGHFLYKAGQLPVRRGRADAALVLKEAEKALAEGAAVIIYPEATATRDPDLWPMVSKTGVARLALASGAPVIPVAHWGTHDILPYGSKKARLFPRKTVRTVAGPPVDLSQWAGQQSSAKALRAATSAIMAEVAALVGQLRGEEPPAVPYDPSLPSKTIPAGSGAGTDPGAAGAAEAGATEAGATEAGADSTRRLRCSAPTPGAPRSRRSSGTLARQPCCGRAAGQSPTRS
jgi:1-acyl-sn-glycerol-3-phosphate acyltransferase